MRRFLVLGVVLLAGCSDTVAPPFAVSFTESQRLNGRIGVLNGQPAHECPYQVDVTASGGSAGQHATWLGATGEFRVRANGATSRTELPAATLLDWFGSDRITVERVLTARRTASHVAGPFSLSIAFRYTMPDGEQRASTFMLFCD